MTRLASVAGSFIVIVLGAVASPAVAQKPDTTAIIRAVLSSEDARFTAMVRADTAQLRNALADDLRYVHSSAQSDTKEQYLQSVGAGTLRYEGFTPKERRVRLLGSAGAVVAGLAHARAAANGSVMDADVRYIAAYELKGGAWRLVAWQTTRVP
jgi:hypothetical protein